MQVLAGRAGALVPAAPWGTVWTGPNCQVRCAAREGGARPRSPLPRTRMARGGRLLMAWCAALLRPGPWGARGWDPGLRLQPQGTVLGLEPCPRVFPASAAQGQAQGQTQGPGAFARAGRTALSWLPQTHLPPRVAPPPRGLSSPRGAWMTSACWDWWPVGAPLPGAVSPSPQAPAPPARAVPPACQPPRPVVGEPALGSERAVWSPSVPVSCGSPGASPLAERVVLTPGPAGRL